MEITKEEYKKIEAQAIRKTAILCNHKHRRRAISNYKAFLKDDSGSEEVERYKKEGKRQLKRKYWEDMYCHECNCVPNADYMVKLLNELIKEKQ